MRKQMVYTFIQYFAHHECALKIGQFLQRCPQKELTEQTWTIHTLHLFVPSQLWIENKKGFRFVPDLSIKSPAIETVSTPRRCAVVHVLSIQFSLQGISTGCFSVSLWDQIFSQLSFFTGHLCLPRFQFLKSAICLTPRFFFPPLIVARQVNPKQSWATGCASFSWTCHPIAHWICSFCLETSRWIYALHWLLHERQPCWLFCTTASPEPETSGIWSWCTCLFLLLSRRPLKANWPCVLELTRLLQ